MANITTIPKLPAATTLTGTEQFPLYQNGATKRASISALAAVVGGGGGGSSNGYASVLSFGAKGDGATDDTAAIQAALDAAAASGGAAVFFPDLTFCVSASLVLRSGNIHIFGNSTRATIKYIGSATGTPIVSMSGAGAYANNFTQIRVANLTISGNANNNYAIEAINIAHSQFENLRLRNVATAGFHGQLNVCNKFDNISVSVNDAPFTTTPVNGVIFDGALTGADYCEFNNLVVEGVSGTGIVLTNSQACVFNGGTSEANGSGVSIVPGATTHSNHTFINVDCEANSAGDFLISGSNCVLIGCGSSTYSTISGNYNRLIEGSFTNITISTGAYQNVLDGIVLFGTLTDSGTRTSDTQGYYAPSRFLGSVILAGGGNGAIGSAPGTGLNKLVLGGNAAAGDALAWYFGTATGDLAQIKAGYAAAGVDSSGYLAFSTNRGTEATPTEKVRLTREGRLGIGTTTPAAVLHVAGAVQLDGGFVKGGAKSLNSGASPNTLVPADIFGGVVFEKALSLTASVSGASSVLLPPAGDLIAAMSNPVVGQAYKLRLMNSGGTGAGIWTISAGHGYDLTASASPSPGWDTTTYKFGTAALNGVGYGSITAFPVSGISGAVQLWVKKASAPGTLSCVLSMHDAFPHETFAVRVTTSGTINFSYATMTGQNSGSGLINVCNGAWHCVEVSWSASSGVFRIFIDGVQDIVTGDILNPYQGTNFTIGAPSYTYGAVIAWTGEIDEVSIWGAPLHTTSTTYTPPSSPWVGNEFGLLALYHLDSSLTNASTGGGWLLNGTMTVAPSTYADFYVTVTSMASATLDYIGSGVVS